MQRRYYYTHSINKETLTQRYYVISPRSHQSDEQDSQGGFTAKKYFGGGGVMCVFKAKIMCLPNMYQ